MKKLTIILFLTTIMFAEIPAENQSAPAPDYTKMFPTKAEQTSGSLVTKDDLNQSNISGTIGYESGIGTTNYKKVTDETGRTYYIDTTTGLEISLDEKIVSQEYTTKLNELGKPLDTKLTEEQKTQIMLEKTKEAKTQRNTELNNQKFSAKQLENQFAKGVEGYATGSSVLNGTILNNEQSTGTTSQVEAYNYYNNGFGTNTETMTKEKVSTLNAGKLKEAYKIFDAFEATQRAKMSTSSLKCFISRELIPQFYCPMNGRQGTKFGGDNLTTEVEAKKSCNENCTEQKQCVSSKVLENIDITFSTNTKEIYPYKSNDLLLIESNLIKRNMMIDYITFDIETVSSSEFTGTKEEFETFLASTEMKFRYSIIKKDTSVNNPSQLLLDKSMTTIKSSIIKVKIPINETGENLNIRFFKPFINEALLTYDEKVNADKYKMFKSITIKNVIAKYKSDKLFYCPGKQFVDLETNCDGIDATLKTITTGSQIYKLCIDQNHKIGPEIETGGFFTEESCSSSCLEVMECLPTYINYSNLSQSNFKANVGCVNSADNLACSVDKCKNLLGDETLRPNNEWVIYNDDKKVQTIYNKSINQNISRPRFNLSDELLLSESSNPDYNTLFQSEMKDTAFANMFKNTTYNNIIYKIGEESPKKMSYYSEMINGQMNLLWNLKPSSFKIDDEKTYNLYVVMELDQLYKPVAGTFIIEGERIQANRPEYNDLQFQDKTYLIKTSDTDNWWKVFKKIEFTSKKTNYDVKRCEDGSLEWNKKGYYDDKIIPSTCVIYSKILWADTPQLNIDRNIFYSSTDSLFKTYDYNTEIAPAFVSQKFSSNTIENTYMISNFIQLEIENAPGGLIRDQESQNYDLSFRKIYNGNYMGDIKRGWPYNYKLYGFYSDKALSYKEILENLTEENIFFDKINPDKYPQKIKNDGTVNNNIKPFILGSTSKTSVNLEIEPYLHEEGQKAFKFMFLYDETKSSTGIVK